MFTIENKFGIFRIQEPSDMHAILSTCFERSLLPYFALDKESTFLDIGTNIGKYSIYVARQGYTTYSFEPNPLTFWYLTTNKNLNTVSNLHLSNYWIGSEDKTVILYHPGNNLWVASDVNVWENHQDVHTTNIQLKSFAHAISDNNIDIRHVWLIKIDVEGSELDVLKGIEPYLADLTGRIIIEISQNKETIFEILQSNWYHLIFEDGLANFVFDKVLE